MTELEERIINTAIDTFAETGLKFTMDDITKRMHISKKTIYAVYKTKEDMLLSVVDYCFADIKKNEKILAADESLDIVEKIKKVMTVIPDRYTGIGLSNLAGLEEKFPNVYKRVEYYLASDWEGTIALLEQAMEAGAIRKVSIPILKTAFESTIESFLTGDVLVKNEIPYETAMQELIDMLIEGVRR